MRSSALSLLLFLVGCASSTELPGVPSRAIAFRAQDLDEGPVTFGSLRGRVVLVTFL